MSEVTLQTLIPVSAGLLEVYPDPSHPYYARGLAGNHKQVSRWSEELKIRFIHRTATNFLDSDEGKKMFDRYTLGPVDFLLSCAKVELALRSVSRFRKHPLAEVWSLMSREFNQSANMKCLTHISNDLLSTIHQCALNESRELIRPPNWISYENFFLFEAVTYGFYTYVQETLKISEDPDSTALAYALLGACDIVLCWKEIITIRHHTHRSEIF